MDSRCSDNFQICASTCKANKENAVSQAVNEVLYTKERYGISDQAYHELSMVSESLPRSWKVKKQRNDMNIQWQVFSTPGDNTIGVQQSFKRKLKDRIKSLEQNSSSDALFRKTSTVRVKLTGDGTYVGPRQHIVTFGFTLLDEGSAAKSFAGNHISIVRGPEDYDSLSICLKDVISEISDIHNNGLEVDRNRYTVQFYLGADWKFLAMACGIDSANSTHACVWCTCPKVDRHRVDQEWSITDQKKGTRTIQSITEASKLPARSKRNLIAQKCHFFQWFPWKGWSLIICTYFFV